VRPLAFRWTGVVLILIAAVVMQSASAARAATGRSDPLGDVSRHAAFSEQARHASATDMPGRRAALVGALGIGADGELRLRAGGSGVLTISLERQVEDAVAVADPRVEVAVPRQYAAGSVKAPGWNCARHGEELTCGAPGTAAAGSLAPIELGLRARGAGRAAIGIDATWRQRGRRYTTSDTARFRVRRPLRVRARSSARRVLAPAPGMSASPIVLSARLGASAKGMPVAYRWHQIGRARRVHWLTATSGRASGRLVTAQVRVPRVKRPTRLRFAVTARSWRGTSTSTTSIVVRPQSDLLLRSPRRLHVVRRPAASKHKRRASRPIKHQPSSDLLVDGPKTQARLEFSAHQQGRRGGHARGGGARALASAADDGGDERSFCSMWSAAHGGDEGAGTEEAPIKFEDGSELGLGGAKATGSGCDDEGAAIVFTDGTLVVRSVRFTEVVGSLSADGLRLRSASLRRPTGWPERLPAKIDVSLGDSGTWGADRTDSGWGPLRAKIDLDSGVQLLPLPAGWRFPQGETTLDYEPLNGAFAVHSVARALKGEPGEVTLDGRLAADGTTTVTVEADDIAELEGVDGNEPVGLSGDGELTAKPGKDGEVTGAIHLSTEAGKAIPLASGLEVEDAEGTWDEDGISLGGEVRVATKSGPFEARVAGSFASTEEWKLEVTQSQSLSLTEGITLSGVHGLLQRVPDEEDDTKSEDSKADASAVDDAKKSDDDASGSHFSIDLSGSVRGWSPSSQLSDVNVTGRLTNVCPEGADGCKPDAVRLAMEVEGRAHLLGQTIPWEGQASVNLKTLALRFSAGIQLAEFGPAALSLTGVQLRLTNEGPQWCTAPGANPSAATPAEPTTGSTATAPAAATPTAEQTAAETLSPDQELSFSASGEGRVLGRPFHAQAELTAGGYCLAGTFGEFDPAGMTAGGRPLIDHARLLYATRDAEVSLAGQTVAVEANQLKLTGELNVPTAQLPDQLRDVLGGRNELALTIGRSDGAFSLDGTATFTFARPIYLIGDAAHMDQAQLRAKSAQLAVAFSSSSGLRLGLSARADLGTPANAAKGIAASTTPLFLAAGIDLGKPSVAVSAGVDTDDPSLAGGTVTNAFGQPELDVRKLVVSASLGADTSFGLSADATLPTAWTSSLGIAARARAAVSFSISQTSPCLDLAIGDPPPADGGTAQTPTVMRLGALSASYAQIVVAPTGCKIGGAAPGTPETKIDPGFALGFDGQIGAAPVTFEAALRLEKQAFALRAKVRVGAFDAGSVRLRRTALDLDVDTGAKRLDIGFSGGLDLGESNIDVDGRFTASEDLIAATLKGQGRLRLADRTFAEGEVDAAFRFQRQGGSWKAQAADVKARTSVLGANVGVIFAYRDGTVATAAGAFEYSASVGPAGLRGGVLFAYAPDGVNLRGDGCNIGQLAAGGDRQLLLRVCGGITAGPLRRDLQMTVSLPQQFDFDLNVPRSEVGVYVASVYLEGALQSSLQLGLGAPRFWVRGGFARAGGCLNMVFWKKCATGIDVGFKPATGRFEGSFLGIPVSWGSNDWRVTSGPAAEAAGPAIGTGDRVLVQSAARVAIDQRASAGGAWRRDAYAPSRGLEVPASAVFDPDRKQISMLVPLPADLRKSVAKPALGYLLTFSGVAFDGDQPRATAAAGGTRSIAYASLSVARVTGGGDGSETALVQRPGSLTMSADGLSLSWNAEAAEPPSQFESALAASTPKFLADGLPLGVTLRFGSAARTPESRQALLRRLD
jgi:hypothetical protein